MEARLAAHAPVQVPDLPQLIDEAPAPDYHYGAAIPDSMDDLTDIPRLRQYADLDEARGIVRYVLNRMKKGGFTPRATLMRRRVTYGPWEEIPSEEPHGH
jgi:hypothetical protein